MGESVPVIMILIAAILAVLAVVALRARTKREEGRAVKPVIRNKKVFFALWTTGLVLALVAASFMFDGDVLGEDTTGIATVIGIMGISLIATSNVRLLAPKRKE